MAWLGMFLIGFTGLAVLAWGWIFWLPIVGAVTQDHGPAWGAMTFGGLLLISVGVAWGLFKLQDRLSAKLDPSRAAGPQKVYCLRCGIAYARDPVVCRECGSTRFSPAPPARTNSQ